MLMDISSSIIHISVHLITEHIRHIWSICTFGETHCAFGQLGHSTSIHLSLPTQHF